MTNQTSLPDEYTEPAVQQPAYSTGLNPVRSGKQPSGNTYGVPGSQGARVVFVRQPLHRFISSTVTTSANARVILGKNSTRRYVQLQNTGAVNVFVGFGTTPNINGANSILLPPGIALTFEDGICPNNEVSVISATSGRLGVLEGNEILEDS